MPSSDAPEVIVARFLKSNRYNETLDAFLKEAGLPPEAAATASSEWTIEKILEEKRKYEASIIYEKTSGEKDVGWTLPGNAITAPSVPHIINSLGSTSNIIAVHVTPSTTAWATSEDARQPPELLVSSADRKISVLSTYWNHGLQKTIDLSMTHNSPVLSITSIACNAFLTGSMSGHVNLYGPDHRVLSSGGYHAKYAVQVTITQSRHDSRDDSRRANPFWIVASAGWDQKICIYTLEYSPHATQPDEDVEAQSSLNNGHPAVTIFVPTNPESILFVRHPDTDDLYLVIGRRDSTYLYYHEITEGLDTESPPHLTLTVREAGRQSLAPHANAWISFSPSSLAACPTDPTLIAVATSHLPHMKLILVRLLFPDRQGQGASGFVTGESQAAQARAQLAIQDREDAAINLHVSTMAPQTPYSTPQVAWRPDGSGVWVNGDDGVVRGVETRTGKVVALLKGHDVGSKVRSLWAGMVRFQEAIGEDRAVNEEEWLVSGGFDKKVIVWKVAD